MNNKYIKLSKSNGKKRMKKGRGVFRLLERQPNQPDWMTRVFVNNFYMVMINDNVLTNKGKAIKAMVRKHDETPIRFHWREMQKIKNEIFGNEKVAIEYYPKESEKVDQANIYWMWIYEDGVLPFEI